MQDWSNSSALVVLEPLIEISILQFMLKFYELVGAHLVKLYIILRTFV